MDNNWKRVKWTEAGQVLKALDWSDLEALPESSLPPKAYFEALRAAGHSSKAVEFLSHALPRWEALAWAARALRDMRPDSGADRTQEAAKRAALLWVQDPTETRRRAAFDAALQAPSTSPECLLAMGVFYSGGSVGPIDCEPLPAPRDAAGKFVAGAINIAALSSADSASAFSLCLDAGAAMAIGQTSGA